MRTISIFSCLCLPVSLSSSSQFLSLPAPLIFHPRSLLSCPVFRSVLYSSFYFAVLVTNSLHSCRSFFQPKSLYTCNVNLAGDYLFLYIVLSFCFSFLLLSLLFLSRSFCPTVSQSQSFLCVSLSPRSLSLHVPDNSCDLDTWCLVLEVRIRQDEVS